MSIIDTFEYHAHKVDIHYSELEQTNSVHIWHVLKDNDLMISYRDLGSELEAINIAYAFIDGLRFHNQD